MEDSSHELEIAQLSHSVAKDLEMLSIADGETPNRYKLGSKEKITDPSPETEVRLFIDNVCFSFAVLL